MGIRLGGKIDITLALRIFPQEVQEELARRAYPAFAPRGDWLWEYPRDKELCLVLSSGVAKIKEQKGEACPTRFILGPGSIIAVSALPLSPSPWVVGIAGTPCSFMKISSKQIQSHPKLRQAFHALTHEQKCFLKKQSSKTQEGFNSRDPRIRMISVLIALSEHWGEDSDCGLRINLPLTEADIATIADTSLEETREFLSHAFAQKELEACGEHLCLKSPHTLLAGRKRRRPH
jgi:hypothetical protein